MLARRNHATVRQAKWRGPSSSCYFFKSCGVRLDFEFRFFGQGILGQLHRNQIRVLRLGFSAEKTFTPMSRKVTWVSRRILRGHKKPVAQPPTFMPEDAEGGPCSWLCPSECRRPCRGRCACMCGRARDRCNAFCARGQCAGGWMRVDVL